MEYPKYKFNKDGVSVLLEDDEAEKALVGDWRNSPADFGKYDAVAELAAVLNASEEIKVNKPVRYKPGKN